MAKRRSPRRRAAPRRRWQFWREPFWLVLGVVLLFVAVGIGLQQLGARASGGTPTPSGAEALPYPGVARIALEEARRRVDAGEAVLLDTRSAAEFERLRAAGALHYPLEEASQRVGQLPEDRLLIFYCS